MNTITQPENSILPRKTCFSWNTIFAGVLGTLMTALVLNLLGTGIGMSLFSFKPETVKTLGVSTYFWFMVVGIVSMYAGSWITGFIASRISKLRTAIYGIMVAGVSTLVSLALMLTTLSALFTSSLSVLETMISVSKSTVNQGASIVDKGLKYVSNLSPETRERLKNLAPDLQPMIEKINQKAKALLPKDIEEAKLKKIKGQLSQLIQAYLNSDDRTYEETKKALSDNLIQITGEKPEDVNKKIEEWYQMYQEAKEKAIQMAEEFASKTAGMLSRMALMNCFILLSSFVAAIFGALHGQLIKIEKKLCKEEVNMAKKSFLTLTAAVLLSLIGLHPLQI